MDKPTHCSRCGRGPEGKIIPIATNCGWFAKDELNPTTSETESIWHDANGKSTGYRVGPRIYRKPTPQQLDAGYKKGLERRQIHGDEIKLKVDTEFVWLTLVSSGNIKMYACTSCRADIVQAQKRANIKPDMTEAMFDDLAEIDAKGKAMREAKKKERRDMNKPVVDGYGGTDG